MSEGVGVSMARVKNSDVFKVGVRSGLVIALTGPQGGSLGTVHNGSRVRGEPADIRVEGVGPWVSEVVGLTEAGRAFLDRVGL